MLLSYVSSNPRFYRPATYGISVCVAFIGGTLHYPKKRYSATENTEVTERNNWFFVDTRSPKR